jgi:hypothetical protein
VPEAAVNEDGEALTAEGEVGAAGDRLVPTPADDVGGAENANHFELCGLIAAGANGSHDLRAFLS